MVLVYKSTRKHITNHLIFKVIPKASPHFWLLFKATSQVDRNLDIFRDPHSSTCHLLYLLISKVFKLHNVEMY